MDSPNVWGGRGAGNVCAVGGGLVRHYTGVVCSVCEGARVTVLRAPEPKHAATAAGGRRKKMATQTIKGEIVVQSWFSLPLIEITDYPPRSCNLPVQRRVLVHGRGHQCGAPLVSAPDARPRRQAESETDVRLQLFSSLTEHRAARLLFPQVGDAQGLTGHSACRYPGTPRAVCR